MILLHTEYFKIKVPGNWGQWTAWSQCRSGCGGYQKRARVCDDPPPSNGGSDCGGELFQTDERSCAKCQDNSDRDLAQGTFHTVESVICRKANFVI